MRYNSTKNGVTVSIDTDVVYKRVTAGSLEGL